METYEEKIEDTQNHAVSEHNTQKNSLSDSNFIHKRSEGILQRKLKEKINNSPKVNDLKNLQVIANSKSPNEQVAQLQSIADNHSVQQQQLIQKKENKTGLPDNLKTGMENLSGISLDDVKVHHNSDKPAQLQAHAYAQGKDIHLGAGKEKHLPHEAWHVVQQKQGKVKPTMQMKGKVNVNNNAVLENEADVMGAKAIHLGSVVPLTYVDSIVYFDRLNVSEVLLPGIFRDSSCGVDV